MKLEQRTQMEILAELINQAHTACAVDYYAVVEAGFSQSKWAEMTGRLPSSVSKNVRRAQILIEGEND